MAKENSPAGVRTPAALNDSREVEPVRRNSDEDDGHLDAEDGERRPRDQAEPRPDDMGVHRHADRHEEQAHQQPAKRLDIGFELVPEIGFRQQQPREKGAQRHRHADCLHQHRRAEHDEQSRRRQHLARATARQQAEQRIEGVMAGQDHEGQRRKSLRQIDQRVVHRAGERSRRARGPAAKQRNSAKAGATAMSCASSTAKARRP